MSTSATKETAGPTKKAATQSETIKEVSNEAVRGFEKALKSGIELQEETVKLGKDLFSQLGSPGDFQARLESLTANIVPDARKQMEELTETFSRTSNQAVDLVEKSLSVCKAGSLPEAQRRVQDVIDSSVAAFRLNVHAALNTNAKILTSWTGLVDRFVPTGK